VSRSSIDRPLRDVSRASVTASAGHTQVVSRTSCQIAARRPASLWSRCEHRLGSLKDSNSMPGSERSVVKITQSGPRRNTRGERLSTTTIRPRSAATRLMPSSSRARPGATHQWSSSTITAPAGDSRIVSSSRASAPMKVGLAGRRSNDAGTRPPAIRRAQLAGRPGPEPHAVLPPIPTLDCGCKPLRDIGP
jgi:hypothetical protein